MLRSDYVAGDVGYVYDSGACRRPDARDRHVGEKAEDGVRERRKEREGGRRAILDKIRRKEREEAEDGVREWMKKREREGEEQFLIRSGEKRGRKGSICWVRGRGL